MHSLCSALNSPRNALLWKPLTMLVACCSNRLARNWNISVLEGYILTRTAQKGSLSVIWMDKIWRKKRFPTRIRMLVLHQNRSYTCACYIVVICRRFCDDMSPPPPPCLCALASVICRCTQQVSWLVPCTYPDCSKKYGTECTAPVTDFFFHAVIIGRDKFQSSRKPVQYSLGTLWLINGFHTTVFLL